MIVTRSGSNLELQFGYSPDMVDAVKMLPDGRRFDAKRKLWVAPVTIDNVRFIINELHYDDPMLRGILAEIEKPLARNNGRKVDWHCTPFKHQVEGLELCLSNDALALFDEQGTGKTLIGIKAIEYRLENHIIERVLIACPKSAIKDAWMKGFKKYSYLEPEIFDGKNRNSIAEHSQICVVSYGLLRTIALAKVKFGMVIFDESHYIKGRTAQRSQAAYTIGKSVKYKLLMGGTPIGKGADDIFSQYKVLDESIFGTNYYAFRAKYFENQGRHFPDWKIKSGAMAEIQSKMSLRSRRVLKKDALDLPEKLYQVRTVDMTAKQATHYRELERELLTEINGETVTVPYLITRMMRLNQICSGYVNHDGKELLVDNPKLAELKQIIDDYDGQVVVWTVFLHDIRAIKDAYPDAEVIDGSKSTVDRQLSIDQFQDGKARIIVLQQQAGAVGITLTAAHLSIFYSRNYSLLDRMQAEDRLHRIGQRNAVTYIDLICAGSIEEDIIEALEEKRLVASYLQGDIESIVIEKFKRKMGGK